jgi:hypothetical protein
MRNLISGLAAACVLSMAPIVIPATSAMAQSCGELWNQRNAIFARNGYCFRTARARDVFGPGCFPPYGRLSPREQARVNEIQYEEDMRGCPR